MITFNARGTDPKTLRALANFLLLAAVEAESVTPAAAGGNQATVDPSAHPSLASGGGLWPGDPGFRGAAAVGKDWRDINGNPLPAYESGDGWLITLRQYQPDDDRNRIVREKFARGECKAPKFPNTRQEWEAGMS